MPQVVWGGQSGCLLPTLIIFNLFFGKLFFRSTALWLGIEGVLILLFALKMHLFVRRIKEQLKEQGPGRASGSRRYGTGGEVIDVEAKVLEDGQDKEKLK